MRWYVKTKQSIKLHSVPSEILHRHCAAASPRRPVPSALPSPPTLPPPCG
uniref:Uncharacterized protein n=1 Tax=Arundo donax TaxID=35708 RepID=A0A0A9AHG6_ARUDO